MRKELWEALRHQTLRICLMLDFLWAVFFGASIMATYYYDKGLSPTEVYVLQSAMGVTAILAEIPTGYISDRCGARRATILGFTGLTACAVVFALCDSFKQFIAINVVSTIFWCLIAGSTSALVEAMKGTEMATLYDRSARVFSNAGRLGGIAAGMVMISIGNTSLPFILQPAAYAVAALVAIKLPNQTTRNFTKSGRMMWQLAKKMLGHSNVRWAIVFFAVLDSSMLGAFWIFQIQLEDAGWQPDQFGAFYLAATAGSVGVSFLASPLHAFSSQARMATVCVATCLLLVAAGLADLALSPWLSMAAFCINMALLWPLVLSRVRAHMGESELPATQQAVVSVCSAGTFAILGPVIGVITEATSAATADVCLGVYAGLGGGVSLWLGMRTGK